MNIVEDPETAVHKYEHLIFDKGVKICTGKQFIQQMMLSKLHIWLRKNEIRPVSPTSHKNQLKPGKIF